MALLEARQISKRFGGLLAVDRVDFSLEEGTIVGLIGPNGAGKTTFFNTIAGSFRPESGTIQFQGRDITGRKPSRIVEMGIARTFQNIRLFANMTTLENVLVGRHTRLRTGVIGAIVRDGATVREERQAQIEASELLALVGIAGKENVLAKNLSYGDQRRVEIARALAADPKLLLLDEPAAGMNPQETNALLKLIARLREEIGLAILLIEHDMRLVMNICERVSVMEYGTKIAEGSPREVQSDPKVIEAYLGSEDLA